MSGFRTNEGKRRLRALIAVALVVLVHSGSGVAFASCPGDCDDNWTVTVDELVRCVNIALGAQEIGDCPPCDQSGDGQVTVDELVLAVTRALEGCGQSPTPTATPTPIQTPTPGLGPILTYFGLADAQENVLQPDGVDAHGRAIFSRLLGHAIWLVVEARPGPNRKAVGNEAFSYDPMDPGVLPDLQLILSEPLGDGSDLVCDTSGLQIGGVPAMEPFGFVSSQEFADAVNDLGCRVDNGQGYPAGRTSSAAACTRDDGGVEGFAFVDDKTRAQFCLPIAVAWSFPPGDTIVAVRVRDITGEYGETGEIVVRVSQ